MYISEIKQLYPKLYEEILQNSHTPNGVYSNVNEAMTWSSTPQGSTFWSLVYEGNIEQAQRMYPELFVLEKDSVREIQNGLFKSII